MTESEIEEDLEGYPGAYSFSFVGVLRLEARLFPSVSSRGIREMIQSRT